MVEQIPLYSRNLAKHILEQMNREEKKHKTVGFQSTNQESVTRCIRSYTPTLLKLCVVPEVESRTQGSRPTPRTQKNPRPRTAFPRRDTLETKDRNARGQGHKRKCSPKKKVFTKIFQAISTKKRFPKNFSSAPQNFNNSKNSAVLEPTTGQFSRT